MNKVYNTQQDFTSSFKKFLKKIFPTIRKSQIKIIPAIIFGMISSENVTAPDIAKKLKGDFSLVQTESVIKRIRRLFKNKLFNGYDLYDKFISFVINTYKKKHDDKRIHIVFDHMFSHANFTVFMISMRIGTQGIPLWFRCFKGKSDSNAFKEEMIKEGISYVSELFDSSFELIFLADRWFCSIELLKYIQTLGHKYCVRLKGDIKVYFYDKKEEHYIWIRADKLKNYEYHPTYYGDIYITYKKFKTNIVISKRHGVDEAWIIITNNDVQRAIKDYGYRYGGVETIFKNQKTNGFNLEKVVNASLKYFESMYSILCIAITFMVIIGSDYSKNTKCYKNVKIVTHKKCNGKRQRTMSLFNVGLTLFNMALNSSRYIRIPYNFILYDS